jgi:hypothetical protein
MPRPKPPEPLKGRNMRMSDIEWLMFIELGGAEWLRKHVKKKAKYPKEYYKALVEKQGAKSGGAKGVVAVHTARPQAIPQTNEATTGL